MSRKTLFAVIFFSGLLSAFFVISIGYIFKDQIPNQPLSNKPTVADQQPQTEEIFLSGLSNTPAKNSEWWQARADHRLLVQSIFACKQIGDATINSLPRAYYRTLLLDLTPDGDHAFRASTSDIASLALVEKTLNHYNSQALKMIYLPSATRLLAPGFRPPTARASTFLGFNASASPL